MLRIISLLSLLFIFNPNSASADEAADLKKVIAVQQAGITELKATIKTQATEITNLKSSLATTNDNVKTAQTTANTAQASANGAQSSASNAQTSANNAQTGANNASARIINAVINEGRTCRQYCSDNDGACVSATHSSWMAHVSCDSTAATLKRCVCAR